MRLALAALTAGLMLTATAAYADDPMADTYANTVTSTNKATGDTVTLLFNADGSYAAKGSQKGQPIAYNGNWALKDGGKTICLTPQVPPNTPNPPPTSCSAFSAHNVGDTWSVTDDQNVTYTVAITAGR